ncbi:arrestin domain-containing protein 3-like [Calliphora vicina]|uniref:arrestin domain-containing protein 3-like n=1 Tax=Calliphora vicina TaxID=7373 RepID=UPI00325B282F
MPSTCKFILNKPNAVYYSGETISGQAIVNISFVQDVRNVRIFVLGEAKIKWCEHAGRHTTYYKSHETYIDNGTNLRIENVLQPGTYTYTFDITLPPLCPTSCECKYGYIRYVLSLKLKGPFGLDNFVFKKPLTVLQKVDLNLHRDSKLNISVDDSYTPYTSGKIFYNVQIPFGAYAPGQTVKYTYHINNQSMTDVDGYTLEFSQKFLCIAKSTDLLLPKKKEFTDENIILRITFIEPCKHLSSRLWKGQFIIPSVPPSEVNCNFIRVEYLMKVIAHVSGHKDFPICIPIVIGTIPLQESLVRQQQRPATLTQERVMALKSNSSSTADLASSSSATSSAIPTGDIINKRPKSPSRSLKTQSSLTPSASEISISSCDSLQEFYENDQPSFEESVRSGSPFIDNDADENHRIDDFRPLYPIYKQTIV